MTYSPDELVKLAESMEAGAAVAEAKANAHEKAGELEERERQLGRAARARHFAKVSRHFHAVVKRREKSAAFEAPTLAEAIAFAQSDEDCKGWPLEDVKSWWRYFENREWKLASGGRMKSWRLAAQNGASRWRRDTKQNVADEPRRAPKAAKKDPDGWRDFLRVLNKPYEAYEFAAGFMQRDFQGKMSKR